MFLWPLFVHLGRVEDLVIVLKASLRSAPVFGWAMQLFGFRFLTRSDRAADLSALRDWPDRGAAVLLFPEGTDLSESNQALARAYASENKLQEPEHVLIP